MGRRITLSGAMLSAALLIAVAAAPASARVPGGEGLVSFGTPTCEGIGQVELFGPRAPQATSGYLIVTDDSSLHVVATRFELTVDGAIVAEKDFGRKAGLTTITCTDTSEHPEEGTVVFTLTAAVVPPR